MLSIKEKLAALQGLTIAPTPEMTPARTLRGGEVLGLAREPANGGELWLRHKTLSAAQVPMFPLERYLSLQPEQLVLVGKNWALQHARPENLLFIDTETTGLTGGAGTYAFLVGIARCQEGTVTIKQYFLHDPDAERPLYTDLHAELEAADAIVSYNGKSYDLPLIRNRCVLNRLDYAWERVIHLDLLHCIRRLYKNLASYALTEVETRLLRFRRQGDIPGSLIPSLYFSTLREGDLAKLLPVFQHNVMDLLSLMGITVAVAERFGKADTLTSSELLPVIRTLSDLALYDQAERLCEGAAPPGAEGGSRELAHHRAQIQKRRGNWSDAARTWQDWIERSPRFDPEPYVELSKYLEHRCGDYAAALKIVERAEKQLAILLELATDPRHHIWNQQFLRRKQRLQRKLHSTGETE
ncbi:MAG TPA: ribonuclease H-like domain-containing protein [bacterium]|nr:ribonuclease H-like domain-containing protein [bacterium]HQI48865.1 ribonuclease H-like domain-containing protein [bacterium]